MNGKSALGRRAFLVALVGGFAVFAATAGAAAPGEPESPLDNLMGLVEHRDPLGNAGGTWEIHLGVSHEASSQDESAGSSIDTQVDEILRHGDQMPALVEALTELGPDCVPAILSRLETVGVDEPDAHWLAALGAIGDTRATLPLLTRLGTLTPLDDPEGELSVEARLVIDALREIGDPLAASAMRHILHYERASPMIRVAAAHALLVVGDSDDQVAAEDYLFSVDNMTSSNGVPYSEQQLARAIAAINTEKSRVTLAERLSILPLSCDQEVVVDLLAATMGEVEIAALLQVVEDREQMRFEWHVQMKALDALLQHYEKHPSDNLKASLLAAIGEMENPTWGTYKDLVIKARATLCPDSEIDGTTRQ
jgi:HEAT repeat protein